KNADYNLKKMELDVTLEEAEITYKKAKVDAEIPKGLESNYKYDQNQLTLQKAEKNLEKARVAKTASLAALKADIETIDINIAEERAKLAKEEKTLAGLTLHATTTGTLVYGENRFQGGKKIQIGDNVMATSTVATVPDKNSLYVEAWTTETGVLKLKPNLEVEFFMDARPDKAFKGSILSVSNNAEKKDSWGNAHYFRVFIKPEKIDTDFMKPGMSVKCVLRTATMENVLLVPVQMTAYRDNDIYCRPKGEEPLKLLPLGINYFYLAVQAGGPLKKGDLLEPIDQMEILQPENPIAQTKAAAQGKSDTKENTGSQETSEALEKPGRDDKSGKHDKSSEGKKHGTEKKTHKKSVPKADNKSAAAGVEVTK
ncbi:MAG: HlyD family efflux transporter periplasmic adaptor subunit, partial [bacterium]|nr:HlyD family efflux transporter periplasmic adaptor subunit [bacterium]